ncbi:MAG: amidohydrolase family protein [Gammaproteobacteria bacterium]|nr:amidohydrolase family protein [Gammaproteobacteria bacterium]
MTKHAITLTTLASVMAMLPAIAGAQSTYIHAGALWDGTGSNIQNDMTIVVEDGLIQSVSRGFQQPGADDVFVDLSDKIVLPGLIDLHVHIESETSPNSTLNRFTLDPADIAFNSAVNARKTLEAGFTTIRELGGSGVNIALRDAINQNKVVGPRIITVGKSLATTGGHADPTNGWRGDLMGEPTPAEGVINSAEEAREAVRQQYKNGADHIKITATGGVLSVAANGQNPQFMMDELQAVVETARDYGMHVAAHAHGKEGMLRAIRAGVHTIEHGTYMDDEVMAAMVEHGTWYIPTISAGKYVAEQAEIEGYYHPLIVPKAREIGPLIQDTLARAYRYGVKIAFGTDASVFPHADNAREFVYMVEAGMPADEALLSATSIAAEVLGLQSQLGSIEAGKSADIIAVQDNPLNNIETLQNVQFVMKQGAVYVD